MALRKLRDNCSKHANFWEQIRDSKCERYISLIFGHNKYGFQEEKHNCCFLKQCALFCTLSYALPLLLSHTKSVSVALRIQVEYIDPFIES